MVNQISSFVIQTIIGILFGFAIDAVLPIKKNAPPKWARVGFWYLSFVIPAAFTIFISGAPYYVSYLCLVIEITMVLLGFSLFYGRALKRKLMFLFLLFFGISSSELACSAIFYVFHLPPVSRDFTQPDMLLISLIGFLSGIIVYAGFVLSWYTFELKKGIVRGSRFLICILMCLFVPIIAFNVDVYFNGGEFSLLYIILMLLVSASNLILIFVGVNFSQKRATEKELGELKHITELEHQHYESVEARREEMAKIRHDYNNILSSVLALLHMNKFEEAEETIKGLLTKVLETREMEYCEIPIVNAVLSEKEAECRKNDIKLNVDLLFPDDISVSHVELCSIFSNLLDNAIRACNRLPKEVDKIIDISVRMKGDYMLICCENSSLQPSAHPDGTGYGMKILKDISKRYSGEFKTQYADGVFSAKLVLLSKIK